jgi:hypothetical protein
MLKDDSAVFMRVLRGFWLERRMDIAYLCVSKVLIATPKPLRLEAKLSNGTRNIKRECFMQTRRSKLHETMHTRNRPGAGAGDGPLRSISVHESMFQLAPPP